METTRSSRAKNELREEALKLFGPRVEFVRVSARNRHERFVVANGVQRFDGKAALPIILGAGDSWDAAYSAAISSDLGIQAADEHKSAVELVKLASQSSSAAEFADKVAQIEIDKANARGASEEEIKLMKAKFEDARKLINDDDRKQSGEPTRSEQDDASPGPDHEGAGAEDQSAG